jgi:hypothetical protein
MQQLNNAGLIEQAPYLIMLSTYIKGNVSGSKKNGNNKSNFLGGNFLEKFF